MISVPALEIHAAHACNFTCESCSHFSSSGHVGVITAEEANQQMGLWSGRLRPDVFRVLGGEPLLNPDIAGVLLAARRHWRGSIELVTNGSLLHRSPLLPSTLLSLDVHLIVSQHTPVMNDALNDLLDDWGRQGVRVSRRNSFANWTRRYRGHGATVEPYEDGDQRRSWLVCPARRCPQLFDGRLWKCGPVAYLRLQEQRWGPLSPKWSSFLGYAPLTPESSDEELAAFFKREDEVVCGSCPSKPERFQKASPLRIL